MPCSKSIRVGKFFVILTTAPCCKGLALESGIQLQQVTGRKQQTKLRHCVQQSWEHYKENKVIYSRKVNIENRSVCQCTLALLTSLCCQTRTCIWSYKTPCNILLSSRAQDEQCFGNKHILNFPLAPDLTVSASCPSFPQPYLLHFILILVFPYPSMCLRGMHLGFCSVSQQKHALMGTACPAYPALFPCLGPAALFSSA